MLPLCRSATANFTTRGNLFFTTRWRIVLTYRLSTNASSPAASEKGGESAHNLHRQLSIHHRRSQHASPLIAALMAIPAHYRCGLGAVTAASAVLNLGFGVVVPVLPSYISGTLGLSAAGVGIVLAAPSIAKMALNAGAGRLADSRGRVPLMVGGELLAAAGVATTGLASSLPLMMAGRVAIGAGSAAASAGSAAWTADLTSLQSVRPHRGVVLGTMSAVVSAAWVLGPAAGGVLSVSLGGAEPMFLGVSAVTALCACAYARCVPEINSSSRQGDDTQRAKYISNTQLLSDPAQCKAIIANAVLSANYALALSILPIQYANVAGAGPLEIGYLFSAVSALGIVGGPLAGIVSDRYGRLAVIAPGFALVSLGNCLLASADAASLIPAAFVWGLGEAFAAPAVAALTADVAPPPYRARSLALSRSAGDASFLLIPPTMGLVADLAGTASTPFYLASLFTALAACRFVVPSLWRPDRLLTAASPSSSKAQAGQP